MPVNTPGLGASPSGRIIVGLTESTAAAGSAGGDVPTTMFIYSYLPGGLNYNGESIAFDFSGNLVAEVGATDQVFFTLGGLTLFDTGLFQATAGGGWNLRGRMYRNATGTIVGFATFLSVDKVVVGSLSNGAINFDNSLSFSLRAQSHVSQEITLTSALMDFRGVRS